MNEVKAKAKVDKNIYVYNDLANAASYFKQRIKERVAKKDRDGIGHDMLACLVLIAFTVEAQFNFLGYRLVKDWNERDDALSKVHTVLKQLGADNELSKAPYKTIAQLKELRDTVAHGKPNEVKWEREVLATEAELAAAGALSADYEAFLKEEFVYEVYDNVDIIWKDLLKRADLNVAETLTHGGIEYTIVVSAK